MAASRRVGPLVRPASAGGGGWSLGGEARPGPTWLGSRGSAHRVVVGRGHGGPVDGIPAGGLRGCPGLVARRGGRSVSAEGPPLAVAYTHLTLPTIYSV